MPHKLGLKVVAEGIETAEQQDLLIAVGCDYGQGYYFSRPVTSEALEALCIQEIYQQTIYIRSAQKSNNLMCVAQ